MKQLIERIYESRSVVGRSGKVHELHSEVDREEGEFLSSVIQNDPTIRKTLEVGCAYGLSSLHICSATQGRMGCSHIIIDPYQSTQWDDVGRIHLEEAGVDFFELLEDKSEFALPRLLEQNEGQFDFVLVDGWHTFDQTLLDCFYATRLLRVGGLLVIDDVGMPPVRRASDFLRNYPCYKEHGFVARKVPKLWVRLLARSLLFPIKRRVLRRVLAPSLYWRVFDNERIRMLALKKTGEDTRGWDFERGTVWHVDTF